MMERKGISPIIATFILIAVVMSLSVTVYTWASGWAAKYTRSLESAVEADINRMKERLAIEYIYYDSESDKVTVYLLNYGKVNDTRIRSVTIRPLGGEPIRFEDFALSLDIGEEGFIELKPIELEKGTFCTILIVTNRGAEFYDSFVV